MAEPTVPPHTLWIADERYFLIPEGVTLPPGPLVLGDLSGHEMRVDPEVASAFELTREEADQHMKESVAAAARRATEVLTGLAEVFREAGNPGASGSLAEGALQGLIQVAMGVAQGNPMAAARLQAASRRTADRIRGTDAELASAIDRLPEQLAAELARRRKGS